MTKLRVGDRAPEFALTSQEGKSVRLSDFIGQKNVVLYFYPKDETPGCTAEAGAFRDSYDILRKLGAEVIGVSSDSVDSHVRFARKCDLPFPLLSDNAGVRKSYGVKPTLGLIPGRVTYIIDKQGRVANVFSSQLNPRQHVTEALATLRLLDGN
jgi:peroxiredoxin Q/BCP